MGHSDDLQSFKTIHRLNHGSDDIMTYSAIDQSCGTPMRSQDNE